MSTPENFFIYRPVTPGGAAKLETLQNEYASNVQSFVPVKNPHVTIFSGLSWQRIAHHQLESVIDNAPKTSKKAFETKVSEAALSIRARSLSRSAIRLVLDDEPDERLLQEHIQFKKRFEKLDKNLFTRFFVSPHITIGYLDNAHAVSTILDTANDFIGTTLNIGKTESNMSHIGSFASPKYSRPINDGTSSSVQLKNEQVRTVTPGGIPQGLLASLRPRDPEVQQ